MTPWLRTSAPENDDRQKATMGPWTLTPLEFPLRFPYLALILASERTMATMNPLQFLQQVRAEVGKIHWPTRREVVLTTVMVFILAALTATFFSLVDVAIRWGLQAVIGA